MKETFETRKCFEPVNTDAYYDNAKRDILALNEVLAMVNMSVTDLTAGTSLMQYKAEIPVTADLNKIMRLKANISIALRDDNIRISRKANLLVIEKYIEGRKIGMREMLTDRFEESDGLTIVLGKDAEGKNVYTDLAKAPHMLVAGMTGSGKSVFMHNVIISLVERTDTQIIMIDPKMSEYQYYHKKIPQFYLYTDNDEALSILQDVCNEMDARYADFAKHGYRDFNDARNHGFNVKPLVVMIDEYADLMSATKNKCDPLCVRIAQKARAAGIHLVIATQYPLVRYVSGGIKANIPVRVAFRVQNGTESRVIIDRMGAEKLNGKGDMLFLGNGATDTIRIKTPYASNDEIEMFTTAYLYNLRQDQPDIKRIDWRRPELLKQEKPEVEDDHVVSLLARCLANKNRDVGEIMEEYRRDENRRLMRRLGL